MNQRATIVGLLPYGNLGRNSVVYGGKVDGINTSKQFMDLSAIKVANHPYSNKLNIPDPLETELIISSELSNILPTAKYLGMVDVIEFPSNSSFAMELVKGFPIIDMNIDCIDPARLQKILKVEAIDQLAESLTIASKNGWITSDLQYFILVEDQKLNGRDYKLGDIVLFDFAAWKKIEETGREQRMDIDVYIKNAKKLFS